MAENSKDSGTMVQKQEAKESHEDSTRIMQKRLVEDTVPEEDIAVEKPQEPSINLQANSVEDTSDISHSRKASYEWFDWFANQLSAVRRIVINLIVLMLCFLFIFFVYRELKTEMLLIEPFEVTQDLQIQGYTGRVITNKLIDQINFIRINAKAPEERLEVMPVWLQRDVEIVVPGSGVSFNSVVNYIKRSIGHHSNRIIGEVVTHNSQLYVTIRISGKSAKTITGEIKNLDETLRRAAEHIWKYSDPYVLAYYFWRFDKKACLEIVQFMLSNEPIDDDPKAYQTWGVLLFEQGDHEGAITKFQEAIELDPKSSRAYSNLSMILERQGDYEGAIVKAKKATEIDLENADAYGIWGWVLYRKGDYKAAIDKYKKAIEIDPKLSAAYYSWGLALTGQKDYEGATIKYRKAIELDPDSSDAYAYCGWALYQQSDYIGAIAKFQKAIELNPKDSRAYSIWGLTLAEQKKYDDAVAKLQKAIELDPNSAIAYLRWGLILKMKGDNDNAIVKYQKAIELDPGGKVGKAASELKEILKVSRD